MPRIRIRSLVGSPFKGMVLGATNAIMIFSHVFAISLVQAAYMISLKRVSLIFAILYGAWMFREEKIGERLFGAIVMIAGVFCIGWFSR